MKKNKKLNNKGFSLVELIIVVAIMALLVSVLAPTYLKYVEQTKFSADSSTYDSIVGAMQILAADIDQNLDITATDYTVDTTANDGIVTISNSLYAFLDDYGVASDTYEVTSEEFVAADFTLTLQWDTDHWEIDGLNDIPQ